MSVAPLQPPEIYARDGPYYLAPFDRLMAPVVAGWARDGRDLFWLAPSTPAPLTAAKVVGWAGPDGGPRLFRRDDVLEPLGYLELNPMPGQPGHHWLGHCVIRQDQRGTGLGRLMIQLVLTEAFEARGARQISLMVFPENLAAYRCYVRTGFHEINNQYKYFPTTGRQYRMVQMSLTRDGYELARPRRGSGAESAPGGA